MKKSFRFLSLLAIVGLVLFSSLLGYLPAQAATMSVLSVDMNDADGNNVSSISTLVNSTVIVFDPATAVNTGDGIQINFVSDFALNATDIDGAVTVSQANSGANIIKGTAIVDVSGQNLQIPITTEGDTPGGVITVTIAGKITTPSTTDAKTITITTWDLGTDNIFGGVADTSEDTGSVGVFIGDKNVLITGTVDPTLSLVLSTTDCALVGIAGASLLSTAINTCSYTTTISTNGTGGYISYIRAGTGLVSGANEIDAATSVVAGTESYGIATNGTVDVAIEHGVTCPATGGTASVTTSVLTSADQSLGKNIGPADEEVTTVCHAASISGTTQAGSYTQTVTITVVGNF